MATLETTTYEQMQRYCEGASQTALYKGNPKYQRALAALLEKYADEVYEVRGTVKGGQKCLDLEIGEATYVLAFTDGYLKAWSIVPKRIEKMSLEKAAEQRAWLNRMFAR